MKPENNFFDLSNLGSLFILEDRELITSKDLILKINQFKKRLQDKGIGSGHKVVLCLNNSSLFCFYLFASWELGACVIPVTPFSTPSEIEQILSNINPALIVYSNGKEEFFENSIKVSSEIALILQTSGSSGKPKGVMLSKAALVAKLTSYQNNLPDEVFKNTLCMLPLNFGHGLISNFLYPLLNGNKVYLSVAGKMEIYSNLGSLVDEYEISCFSSVPSILKIVSNFSEAPVKKTLKKIFCASAPLDIKTWEKTLEWSSGVQVNNMYGMTEMASWIAGDQKNIEHYEENTFDHPWGAEVKIVKDDASDEYGEIFVKSKAMMSGYYLDQANTEKVMIDGWFKTGDIGELKNNRIILKGRKDNVINIGGVKIYPEEINRVVKTHLKIADCFTLGLRKSFMDSDHGIGCLLIPKPGQTVSIEEILDLCKIHLSIFKIPSQFKIIEKLPVNERGKADQQAIKLIFQPGKGA